MYMLKKFVENHILGRCGVYALLLLISGTLLCALSACLLLLHMNTPAALLSGISVPIVLVSAFLFALDVVVLRNVFLKTERIRVESIAGKRISVGMTAYNDEECIGNAVSDFLKQPTVAKVTVIDNNCTDLTRARAEQAGAAVVTEPRQGYGYACMRALEEASKSGDIIVLVEGDETFSAGDLKKLLPYLENCDMVVGTRTTRELNDPDSQMDWLMILGNIFVAKLLQTRFWGTRLTDVGCTYRVIKKESYEKIRARLTVGGMHFLPHMLIQAVKSGLKVIEVPITFRKRSGESKGVGSKKLRAVSVGFKMLLLILFS